MEYNTHIEINGKKYIAYVISCGGIVGIRPATSKDLLGNFIPGTFDKMLPIPDVRGGWAIAQDQVIQMAKDYENSLNHWDSGMSADPNFCELEDGSFVE